MKRIALILCAVWALGAGAVVGAQAPAAGGVVGTAPAVDETALAIGDSAAPQPAASTVAGPSTFAYFLRMLVVLALVLAAIYGVYRLMRRVSRPRSPEDSPIKLLASSSLGPGKALHVVSLGTQAWLIGAAEGSVSLIAELSDRELIDGLELKAATSGSQLAKAPADFAALLSSLLGGKAKRKMMEKGGGDFLASQRDRLRKL